MINQSVLLVKIINFNYFKLICNKVGEFFPNLRKIDINMINIEEMNKKRLKKVKNKY